MPRRRLLLLFASILAVSFATPSPSTPPVFLHGGTLPARLSDAQFQHLMSELSEPDGRFRSDNLLSNEIFLQHVIPELVAVARPARAYLGVGPEQNFTYIAALRPRMAFIIDIRRDNLRLHLMYKALFELSADRAAFVSRLFSRPRPSGLGPESSAKEMFDAFARVEPSEADFQANVRDIRTHLRRTRRLQLDDEDLQNIEGIYSRFYSYGPVIQYWSTSGSRTARTAPTYAELMVANDGKGQPRSYLASEESFAFIKEMHTKNLLVPVVGNFAGPKALRAVGRYLKDHGAIVSAFYLSNVEQYLEREGRIPAFCGNVEFLPLDPTSTFIKSVRNGNYAMGVGLDSVLRNMTTEAGGCR